MDKRYNPQRTEDKIYQKWEKSGSLKTAPDLKKKPFCIIMPPPNANDPLHMGHALFVTLEDLMIRYHRMIGDATLWLPGADHAGIETQYVFEKKLAREGKSRFDFTRDNFYKAISDYVEKNKSTMINQLKSLGASCDWSRFKYTLDPEIIKIVYQTFKKLVTDGLAYRSEQIINFCTRCGTAFSDLEVKYQERIDPLYYIKYGPFTLATVRPETKFGDTAVAVHPKDKRYQKWVGTEIEVAGLTGKFKLKVIADEAVDPQFGSGVIKVTPAHDPVDFEIGQRHKLAIKRAIDFDGKLTSIAGPYQGLYVSKARNLVAQDLAKKGLITKTDPNYKHAVGICYRCGTVIEPMVLPQWFIDTSSKFKIQSSKLFDVEEISLKEAGILAVKKGLIEIIPKKYGKQYLHWVKNLRNWNISRQIWWGIPIPVSYCQDCNKIKKYGHITWVPKDAQPLLAPNNKKCPQCNGKNLIQDPDTFDTWFSSAQWPFATLKTAKKGDFDYFYPTSVMETAYDILYFWVVRMIMIGIYVTGNIPFKTVYLHGLLRDVHRQKMSKSKGNVINPLQMTQKYGADALRMALIVGSTPGNDVVLWEKKIEGYRNFANKLWNIARFIELAFRNASGKVPFYSEGLADKLAKEDKKIIKLLDDLIEKATKSIENYKFSQAASSIYEFIWHKFADWYLEYSKERVNNQNVVVLSVLRYVQLNYLKLLHPFMPFVTEEVWSKVPGLSEKLLITSKWPQC